MSQAYHPPFPAPRNTFTPAAAAAAATSSSKLPDRSAANNSNNNNLYNAAVGGNQQASGQTQPTQPFGRSAPAFAPQRAEAVQPLYGATYTGLNSYGAGGAAAGAIAGAARVYGPPQPVAPIAARQDVPENVLAELSDEQKEEINDAFSLFDLDKDRHIDYHELRVSLRALGFQTPKPEALQLMQQYGVPKPLSQTPNQPRHPSTLLLPHNTFLLIAARKLLARDPREEVARAFSLFDVAGKGYIDIEDLRRVTRELGETSLSEAELEAMVEEFDYEGIPGGGVSRDAFFGICLG